MIEKWKIYWAFGFQMCQKKWTYGQIPHGFILLKNENVGFWLWKISIDMAIWPNLSWKSVSWAVYNARSIYKFMYSKTSFNHLKTCEFLLMHTIGTLKNKDRSFCDWEVKKTWSVFALKCVKRYGNMAKFFIFSSY